MKRVAVFPAAEYERRTRLFGALARTFAVDFVPAEDTQGVGAESVVAFGEHVVGTKIPSLRFLERAEPATGSPRDVVLSETSALMPPLRGAIIPDINASVAPSLSVQPGDEVLASVEGHAIWTVNRAGGSPAQTASVAPREVGDGDSLRDQLKERNFVALLPLVHLLRETADYVWPRPPLRATFVIDDPNLHSNSYGYLDFAALAAHATETGYHVSIATVPFDQWFVRGSTARIFRSNPAVLSLAIHGNDHTRQELARPFSEAERAALLASALARMSALERGRQVDVSRVMVAPHETCAAEMMLDMARMGFAALCFGFGSRFSDQTFASWDPADFVHGLPVLARRPLTSHRGELALRAFLGQPLILGGHHDDLAEGLDVLADAADSLNRFGDVRWLSLGDIARSNVSVRRDGDGLGVCLFTRQAEIHVPEGVQRLSAELPSLHHAPSDEVLDVKMTNETTRARFDADSKVSIDVETAGRASLELEHLRHIDFRTVPRGRSSVRAAARRAAVEARDRAKPLGRWSRRVKGP